MKVIFLLFLTWTLSVFAESSKIEPTIVNVIVSEKGFEPNKIDVSPNSSVLMKITRKTDNTCSTSIQIPSLKVKRELPLNKTVEISLGKLAKGEIKFGCGMNMMDSGRIYVQ